MVHIFLDTNILLHFKSFDQIAWNDIVNDDYQIVIAPVVLFELDKRKYDSNKKKASKSKAIALKIESIIDGSDSFKKLIYISQHPNDSYFDLFKLDKSIQDDQLLASILEYKMGNTNVNILLITDDIGPRLKSKTLNITSIKLDEFYRLTTELDESEKRIRDLTKENLELRNALPKMEFEFVNSGKRIYLNIPVKSKEDFIKSEIERLKLDLPSDELAPIEYIEQHGSLLNTIRTKPSREQIANYNKSLQNFRAIYNLYLKGLEIYFGLKYLTYAIDFGIKNIGTAVADDIDVVIFFPTLVKVYNRRTLFRQPIEPYPPIVPTSFLSNTYYQTDLEYKKNPERENEGFEITVKETRTLAKFKISHLKHNHGINFDSLFVQFENLDERQSFSVDFEIHVNNLPKPETGKVNIILKPGVD